MKRFLIVPLENIETDIIKSVAYSIEKVFNSTISIGTEVSIPKESFEPTKKQYYSMIILDNIRRLKVKSIDRVLGVANVVLYVPELNFIFREADTHSGIALVSLKRLRQ